MSRKHSPVELHPSPGLVPALRACSAAWSILGPRLAGSKVGPRPRPALELVQVEDAERDLGSCIPNDLLIIAAWQHPIVCALTGIQDLDTLLKAHEDADAAPPGWITVGVFHGHPIAALLAGEGVGPACAVAVRADVDPGVEPMVRIAVDGWWGPDAGETGGEDEADDGIPRGPLPLGTFIMEMLKREILEDEQGEAHWAKVQQAVGSALYDVKPAPRIVDGLTGSRPPW